MKKRLILMRHAKSNWNQSVSDHERDLNARGRTAVEVIRKWLQTSDYVPDEAMVSTAIRTRETHNRLKLETERFTYIAQLYHASVKVYLECLQKAKGQTVLILGHNPGVSDFAAAMTVSRPEHNRFDNFPTCATWVADFAIADWKDVRAGMAVSVDFAIPRELIEARDNR
jgi:phosphohistidine phosphatase